MNIRRWAAWVLVACALATLGSLIAVRRLRADTSLQALFSADDPAAAAMVRVLDRFSSVEELLVLATASGEKSEPEKLKAFASRLEKGISEDAGELSGGVVWRADDQTRAFFEKVVVPAGLFYLDDASFERAKKRLTRDEMTQEIRRGEAMISAPGPAAQAMSKVLLKDPLRLHEFILDRIAASRPIKTYQNSDAYLSADGTSILIRVRGRKPVSDLEFSAAFTKAVRRVAEKANADGLELNYSGSYAIAAASQSAIRADTIASVISSVVLLQGLFLLAYRRPIASFLLAMLPVTVGVLYGFGAYAILKPTVTPLGAVIGGILAGMAIDYSIQYLAHHERRRGEGPGAALATLKELWPAMLAAWATSVVGFVAIGSANVRALRDFSLLGALGLSGAFLATMTLLPAVLSVTAGRSNRGHRPMFRVGGEPILQWVLRRRTASAATAVILFVAALAVMARPGDRLPFSADLSVMHPRPNPALAAQETIARRMGIAPGALIMHLRSDSPGQLLELAHRVEEKLQSPPVKNAGVASTFGLASLLPNPRTAPARIAATGEAVANRVVADFHAAIGESLFDEKAYRPYEEFLRYLLTNKAAPGIAALLPYRSLAETILPKDVMSGAAPPTEAVTYVLLANPTEDRASRDAVVDAVRGAMADMPGATLTGLSVLSHDAEANVRRQLPKLILVALGAVALYLLIYFRNPTDCLLAMAPTVFSFACLLAFLRLSGEGLNMINLVAFPLLIGIDVDYGIFLVTAARRGRRETLRAGELAAEMGPSAIAVLLCGLSTLLGFGSLATTSIPAVRSLGLSVAVGIVGCLICCFFLIVPAIFILSEWNQSPKPEPSSRD